MKKKIHPKFNKQVKVTCSCGNTFFTGSILDEIVTELCSKCHPFYTGEQKIVDTENLVAKFKEREKKAKSLGSFKSKREKMLAKKKKRRGEKKEEKAVTLKDMLSNLADKAS